jgi:hypothetical protein
MASRFVLLFWGIGHIASAQSSFFLRPSAGLAFPLSREVKKSTDPTFKTLTLDLNLNLGIDLVFERNETYQLFTGWNSGAIGYGFRFQSQSKLGRYTHNSGTTVHRIPFGAQVNLGKVRWFYSKKKAASIESIHASIDPRDVQHNLKFKVKLIAGFSIDRLNTSTNENSPHSVSYYYPEDNETVFYNIYPRRKSRIGVDLMTGLGLNFYSIKGDHAQLTFLFSQGLLKVLTASIEYGTLYDDGREYRYHSKLGVNGSYLSIQLSYPIHF